MAPESLTYGALLVGGLIALFLSGVVSTQAFYYRRSYLDDRLRNKIMVLLVWILDLLHSSFVIASVFRCLVNGIGNPLAIRRIAWEVSVTISITGILTFIIHLFFTHRVWTLSKCNKALSGTIALLAFLRMLSAFGTVVQMSRFKTWQGFHDGAGWTFTTGLAISASVDFIIATSLCYFLQKRRTGFKGMDEIIDSIIRYTVESGLLTFTLTVASFVCWLTMPSNFIFLALHFCISKTYANSFLATLNARSHIKERAGSSAGRNNSIRLGTVFSTGHPHTPRSHTGPSDTVNTTNTVQITVEKSVHCVTDVESAEPDPTDLEPVYAPRDGKDVPFNDLHKLP
ncbi:uncharacterized protein PHACADRAFT_208558 [Phanerochaete carnosa HHB-10118-sp]|uniref:DUF6534 domain-containing protein n=1 Tax=Phanerochaete carnosa (strain HHB-10118-sp) TaxID=650164 RepID=K5W7T0_PHACS|nr:uncharacterized protein PHACADRAFT_208558 [Phanerochaete carnosa HHB-10118-sp]EKM55029.1 hypothetical protein PHACADRAFT_208558 [Phanerochaete carnosa HHB-10118-sp]